MMKSKSNDEAMVVLYRDDPQLALEVVGSIVEEGDKAELLILLRQLAPQTFCGVQAAGPPLAGSRLPIAVAHGEGFANFEKQLGGRGDAGKVIAAMRFTDNHGKPATSYPANPNGSPDGLTAVTTPDGRFTAMMPHPERVFRNLQMSWTPLDSSAHSPWMQLWHNARRWVG